MASIVDLRVAVLDDNPSEWPALPPETVAFLKPRGGVYTPDQAAALAQIARGRWFFLRNHGASEGYSYRCARCGAVHDYFTLHCIERPFNGLTQAIGLLLQRTTDRDTDILAHALGAVVPITARRARVNYRALRDLGYDAAELLGEGGAGYSPADLRAMAG